MTFFFFYVGGRTKVLFLHNTEKHFKFLYTEGSWCFQKFFTAFLHCKFDFSRRHLPSDTLEAMNMERGRNKHYEKAAA